MAASKVKIGGFSRLALAWIGLLTGCIGLVLAVFVLGDPEDAHPSVVISVDSTPDLFAVDRPADYRPLEAEMYGAGAPPPVETPLEDIDSPKLPQVRAATAAERAEMEGALDIGLGADLSVDIATKQSQLPSHLVPVDENTEVISVLDLPKPGEEETYRPSLPTGKAPGAPHADLYQVTKDGPYPRVAQDGRTPRVYYARGFVDAENRDAISIMVGGLGLNPDVTRRAIEDLPPEVTLAFAPYARDLETWAQQARAAGHEVIIELPMEANGFGADKLGPASLLTTRSVAENQQRLAWVLSRFSGYFGVTNYLGDMVTANPLVALPILTEMQRAGIAYIDDTGVSGDVLDRSGIAYARVDFSMVNAGGITGAEETMIQQLVRLEDLAAARGKALGKTYASVETIAALKAWTAQLDKETFALAPVSAMVVGP